MEKFLPLLCFIIFCKTNLPAENGYRLWLRYDLIDDQAKLESYRKAIQNIKFYGDSPTLQAAKKELKMGLTGLLGRPVSGKKAGWVLIGKSTDLPTFDGIDISQRTKNLGKEGYTIFTHKKSTVIAANSDEGVLYGVFLFLRLLQTHQDIAKLDISEKPQLGIRILNHWDNLDRTVERGYAGFSIWNWHTLPEYIDQRYIDYARANASIGINGAVVTNVNANALVLRSDYLEKVKALADVMRPFNIKMYLTARFSAPIELGGMATADPLDPAVQRWWKEKMDEVYRLIPDFGGFVVKANSEGQPGPQSYGRTHADGANMLADALAPHGGIVMWRAFVYSDEDNDDRHRQAYSEFVPRDGTFRENVMVQVKNGPIDFMPREPAHPMFGAMPKTPLMMEFQITQEYLGQGTHLVYLGPMWQEVLYADTYANGKNSQVFKVIDGSLHGQSLTGMAGVANIGNDINWTGYLFGQANWYAFGQLAWNPQKGAGVIAEEWLRMTFSNEKEFVGKIKTMMLASHELCVNYMTPLGLHHIMATGHHYGPGPWVGDLLRPEWNPTYYHRADEFGLGFDRTETGSNAVEQYFPPVRDMFSDRGKCPQKYLLWFHHVGWKEDLGWGRTLWEELCHRYHNATADVSHLRQIWNDHKKYVDEERFRQVDMMLQIQGKEAKWWRDACLTYFQTFSKMDIPKDLEQPVHGLEYYKSLSFPYSPGIRPGW